MSSPSSSSSPSSLGCISPAADTTHKRSHLLTDPSVELMLRCNSNGSSDIQNTLQAYCHCHSTPMVRHRSPSLFLCCDMLAERSSCTYVRTAEYTVIYNTKRMSELARGIQKSFRNHRECASNDIAHVYRFFIAFGHSEKVPEAN